MARLLDKVNVIDVEATCWEGNPPLGQKREIIEVGITVVDIRTLELLDNVGYIVRPQQSKVSEFCTRLTSITQAEVDKSRWVYATICKELKKRYKTKDRPWVSWGDYDRNQFQRQSNEGNTPYPFGPTHINLKNLFALSEMWPKEDGMYPALNKFGLKLKGFHHRGRDDSYNIAMLFVEYLRRYREHKNFEIVT